tara:strand:- start:9315 stop:11570 length:2256 start_codon:yes stop_codon:yes gene_type:complete
MRCLYILCVVISVVSSRTCVAQPEAEQKVRLNLPNEIEVQGLVDYVSERLGIQILYDEKIATKKINIRAPGEIPVSSLLGVLQSALRLKGLTIVDADAPGWKKIVEATRLPEVSIPQDANKLLDQLGGATAVTQAFVLEHVDATTLESTIEPFITPQGANTIALKEQGVLIVSDYASNLVKLAALIDMIDRPRSLGQTVFLPVENQAAAELAAQVTAIIEARKSAQGTSEGQGAGIAVFSDERTNKLVIVGEKRLVEEIQTIVKQLDVPLGRQTEVYPVSFLSAERLDRLITGMLDERERRGYEATVDSEENLLVITASDETQERVAELLKRFDVALSGEARSRLKIYKLKYITADEALETLRSVEDAGARDSVDEPRERQTDGRFRLLNDQTLPAPNLPQLQPTQQLPEPPAFFGGQAAAEEPESSVTRNENGRTLASLLGVGARITGDRNTNSLIIVAEPDVQQLYAELIKALDVPRPQVLIEARIVILDSTDDFSLGVEVSGGDRSGDRKLFSFSSFGLSQVDNVSGALSLIPGVGFNGALVDPSVADVVLRAFSGHRKAKVVSAPRLLVNDNATGLLTSVAEVPFTSVNASQTVATTSFAGFADAGTTISVTPHIGDNDELQLEYRITLNEFQGQVSAGGVPPPRQTDEIESVVRIPDGHTLIVGGLNRTSVSDDRSSIPFLENIPLLRHAVSNTVKNNQQTSLFIFLRPIILRDDKFRSLKYYSRRDAERADNSRSFPASKPLLIR